VSYEETRRARRAAGLCLTCGAERMGEGCTGTQCARCAQRSRERALRYIRTHPEELRERRHAKEAARKAMALCPHCGREREPEVPFLYCVRCRAQKRASDAVVLQKERNAKAGVDYDVPPWPTGGAVPRLEGGNQVFRVGLNLEAQRALYALLQRYRDQEWAAGRMPKTHQVSRIVRDAVLQWEKRECPSLRPPMTYVVFEWVHVSLDGPTRAIVRRQAAHPRFDGNRSAALRAMIYYAAFPFVVGATGGPKRWQW